MRVFVIWKRRGKNIESNYFFATYGLSGINWTRKTLDEICKGATMALPYDTGVLKKGDYDSWIKSIKQKFYSDL